MKTLLPIVERLFVFSKMNTKSHFGFLFFRQWKFFLSFLLFFNLCAINNLSAQITHRGTQTSTTGGTTLTITKPTGLAVNDLMIANIAQSNNDSNAMSNATRTGWTLITSALYGSTGSDRWHGTLLYKVADAADVSAASFAFTLSSGSDDGMGAISAYTGVNGASPFDVTPGVLATGSSSTVTAPSITTVSANTAIVMCAMISDNVNFSSWNTATAGVLNELLDLPFDATVDMGIGSAAAIKPAAGPTGVGTASIGTTEYYGAVLLALRPVTVATGTVSGPLCAGNAISVPFTISGPYAAGNVFTAQLSNSSGSFATPISIGSLTSTTAGNIPATIPAGQTSGTGYRIRVISSTPAATGSDNSSNISINATATSIAGPAFSTCANSGPINITSGSSATNYSTVQWSSSGSGTFSNAASLTAATYDPSPTDISAGSVTLTLTAIGVAPCANATSTKVLSIKPLPTATAGGSQTICSNGSATVSGATATNGTISWTGNGSGTISGGTTLTPTYTPASGENGTIILTMTVSNSPCASATATYTVSVTAAPTSTAGNALTMCADAGSINITSGATTTNSVNANWTSNGSGTFSNANSLTLATYTPSAADAITGSVTLTLTASGNSPCANATSTKTLTIKRPPTASAGGNQTICQNGTATVNGASAANGTIAWTTNGAGSLSGASTLTPTYTAAAGDAGNNVTLTMTVSNSPCASATAIYTIHVNGTATAIAGSPLSTCSNSGAINITSGSSATNNAGINWTSSGTGGFSNSNSLTSATYSPSASDIAAGSVTITLTATGNAPCANAVSTKTLTILPVPVTTGVSICPGGTGSLTSSTVCTATAPISGGTKLPASGTTGGTGTAWANPTNIFSDNNVNATVPGSTSTDVVSQTLTATNFGFSIPANATITGVQCAIGRYRSGGLTGEATDNLLKLVKSGTVAGTNKAATTVNWPSSEGIANYGSTSDMWGTTLNAADVNATNFGVALIVDISQGFLAARTAQVDYIQLTVTYTLPGTLNWYTVSSGGTPIGSGLSFNPVGVAGSGLANTSTPGTTTFWAECATVAGCRTPTTFVINALPTVSFTGLSTVYCANANPVTLTGNHAPGGSFSGPGITNNGNGTANFNPTAAGVGTHSITYSYTDGNTCVNTFAQSVNVNANVTYYADADGDSYGNPTATQVSCTGTPTGYVLNNTDCNDNDNTKHATFSFYADNDGDTYGTGSSVNVCAVNAATPPAGYSLNNTDCNDNDNTKHATFPFYADNDGDTYGAGNSVNVCAVNAATPPAGYSLNATDCNDSNATIFQSALLYTDLDNDGYNNGSAVTCYGSAVPTGFSLTTNGSDCDDTNAAVHATFPFYADNDGDTYGAGNSVNVCAVNAATPPAGYSLNATDCNDSNATVFQSALLYTDLDNDGYNNGSAVTCYGSAVPTGYSLTTNGSDCNDTNAAVHATFPFYADNDGDTYGAGNSVNMCAVNAATPPAGYSLNATDCNDSNATIFQSALLYTDLDNDGYDNGSAITCYGPAVPTGYSLTTNGSDCNDTNAAVHATFPFYADNDGDTYGAGNSVNMCAVNAATPPAGYSLNATDCNDANATVFQSALLYTDLDNDGYNNGSAVTCYGSTVPTGYSLTTNGSDCNDTNAAVHATFPFYADNDGDTYGAGNSVNVCAVNAATPPASYSLNATDCNDSNETVFQSGTFYVDADNDGYDNGVAVVCFGTATPFGYSLTTNGSDCNDTNSTMHAAFPFYVNADGDGYGVGNLVSVCAVNAATSPAGYSSNNGDCNDNDASVYQSGLLYVDNDNDGYTSGVSATVCYGSAIPSGYVAANIGIDCNDNVSTIHPGATEILYNGADDNCNGQLDEGFQLKTKLLPSDCGSTLASIGSLIGITTLNNSITGYRIKVTNGATVYIIERNVPHFTLTSLPSYEYATTYSVEIELQRNGIWLGYYGDACLISSPAVLAQNGASQITPSQCGITLSRINTLVATTSLPNATGYRFRITNVTQGASGPNVVQTIERSLHWFSLTMLQQYNYNATYRVEVAVKTTGNYTGFGSPCEVSSPASPSLNNCGGVIATPATLVATASLEGITQYRFQVVRISDGATTTIDRNTNYFTFNMVPGYTRGAQYAVRVAVMTVGTWSTFGDACEITAPGSARYVAETVPAAASKTFKAAGYPNPFESTFTLGVSTPESGNVFVKIYDMTGRLVESRQSSATDLDGLQIGDRYPSGVYNIIVTQSGNVKTLRMVKR